MRYLLATYFKKPDGKFNEAVKVDTKVRLKDLQSASIIIDYKDRKIIKSNFAEELGPNSQHDFDTINDFYKQHYPDLIAQIEAKYEVLHAALDMASTIVNDVPTEEIAKDDITD